MAIHPTAPAVQLRQRHMKRVSNYLKMRVLGALEHAQGHSDLARYQAVSQTVFLDEDGHPCQFT